MQITDFLAAAVTRLTGFRPVRALPMRDHIALMCLKAKELGVRTVLDIGANTGQFGGDIRRAGWAGHIVSFEPLRDAHAGLTRRAAQDPLWTVPPAMAIGGEDGETTINVSANSVSSSLLPAQPWATQVNAAIGSSRTEAIAVRRLDTVASPAWEAPFAMKIDTQGFEMEVLRGAPATLRQAMVVTLEMSLAPAYAGGASFCDLYRSMEEAGLRCIALTEGFADRARNEVLEVDGTFIRSPK